MTCPNESELALYTGGEATPRQIARVERHVRTCSRCSRKVAEFQLIRSAVATSGSPMPPGAREQVRAEILALISREPSRHAGIRPLLPIASVLGVLIVLLASAGVVSMLQLSQTGELRLALPLNALDPPAHAFMFSAPPTREPASSPEPIRALLASRGKLESAQLRIVRTEDGLTALAQLRIPASDPSLEIHWIME